MLVFRKILRTYLMDDPPYCTENLRNKNAQLKKTAGKIMDKLIAFHTKIIWKSNENTILKIQIIH